MEIRSTFKIKFLEKVATLSYGEILDDFELETWARENELAIGLFEMKNCIRELEQKIGNMFRYRLLRVRGKGWQVLEPVEQAHHAVEEGSNKIKRTLKKTAKRIESVDVDKLPEDHQHLLLNQARCINALIDITERVYVPKITYKQVEVLDSADRTLRALAMFKKTS